jgi:hypothetical protein
MKWLWENDKHCLKNIATLGKSDVRHTHTFFNTSTFFSYSCAFSFVMLVVFFCVMMKILEFSSGHVIVNKNVRNNNRNKIMNNKNDIKSRQCLKRCRRGKHCCWLALLCEFISGCHGWYRINCLAYLVELVSCVAVDSIVERLDCIDWCSGKYVDVIKMKKLRNLRH